MFAVLNYECSAIPFFVFLVSKYSVKFNKKLNQGITLTIMIARVALATVNLGSFNLFSHLNINSNDCRVS